jgi:dipeptidyl aminopeptidase/acylaminoacyl peptidase
MDDMQAIEQRLARELARRAGPSEPVDDAAIFTAITATTSPKWKFRSLFGATRFAVAAVVVALFGGFLFIAQPSDQVGVAVPDAEGLPPVTGPAGNGLIAFARDGDIYLGDPVTGESEAIVAGPEMDTDPVFSPDGMHLAFWRVRRPADEVDLGERDLVVVRADGSDERVVKPPDRPFIAGIGDFVWSPDSRSLVVTQWTGGGGPEGALWLVDAAGVTEARPLASNGPLFFGGDQVAWFLRPPSGDRLLVSDWGADPIIAVRDVDGSDVLDLGETAGLEEARLRWAAGKSYPIYQYLRGEAAWSPDASRIAFVVSFNLSAYTEHLYVMDADGSDLRLLTDDGVGLAWSPDGSSIATYQANRVPMGTTEYCPENPYQDFCATAEWLTIFDVETGADRVLEATRLPNPGESDPTKEGPAIGDWSWSPDGRSIVMMQGGPGTRPLVIDVASDTSTELPWESDSAPSWQRVAAD